MYEKTSLNYKEVEKCCTLKTFEDIQQLQWDKME